MSSSTSKDAQVCSLAAQTVVSPSLIGLRQSYGLVPVIPNTALLFEKVTSPVPSGVLTQSGRINVTSTFVGGRLSGIMSETNPSPMSVSIDNPAFNMVCKSELVMTSKSKPVPSRSA